MDYTNIILHLCLGFAYYVRTVYPEHGRIYLSI